MTRAVVAPTPQEVACRGTVSVPEAAAFVGTSANLLYELIAAGEFPHLRLGRRIVVPAAELLKLVGRTAPQGGRVNTTDPTTKNGPAAGQGDGSSVPDPTKEQNLMSVAPATQAVNHDVVPVDTRVLLEDGATAVVTAHRPGLFAHVVRLDTPDPDGHRVAFVARDGLKPIQHAAWCSPTNCHDDVHPHTGRLAHVSHGSTPHVWAPVPADPDARFESYLTRTDTVDGTDRPVGPTTVYVHAQLDDEVGVDEYVAWARKVLAHAEQLAAAASAEVWSDEPIPYLPAEQVAHDDGTREP